MISKMKILHYIPSVGKSSGGVGAYMQLLARDLGRLCELHVLTHKENDELALENCQLHYIPNKFFPWDNCRKDFVAILRQLKPDIVHTNSCWTPVSAMVAVWAKKEDYPVFYTPHGMLEPYAIQRHYWTKKLPAILLFQKKGISVADIVHATAGTEKENLLKLGWNKNIYVVPNCVQIDKISQKSSWCRTKNILFLSRVHPKKGVNFLIEAVAQLKENLAGYKVTIAGFGEESYISSLKELAAEKGVLEMFHFIGPVFDDKKWDLYKQADLFVLPTYSENFGIVVPEALASGTPVITTLGTPWQELNSKHCGWCVDVGTLPLVGALREFVLCSETELKTMGRNGRNLVEEKYTSEAVASQFMKMYHYFITNESKSKN